MLNTRVIGKAPGLEGMTGEFANFDRSWTGGCTDISGAGFRTRLTETGNLFADAPGIESSAIICLPPEKITVTLSRSSLVFRNPICELSFFIGGSIQAGATSPDGELISDTLALTLIAETTYFRWRAHSPDKIDKYRYWATHVIAEVKKLLES